MTSYARAVKTLYWRRFRLTFRNKSFLFARLFQPFFWLVVLGTTFNNMFAATRSLPVAVDYLSFMAVGLLSMTIVFTSLFAGMSLVWDREYGVLKEFLAAPIPRAAIPIGNALAAATEGIIQSLVILLIALALGAQLYLSPIALVVYLVTSFFVAINLYGIAASIASRFTNTQSFIAVVNLLTMPLFFVSGAIYPIQYMPKGLQEFAILSPVTHSVAVIRYYMLGAMASNLDAIWSTFSLTPIWLEAQLSLIYVAALALGTITIASLLFRRVTI